jgi:hypothetical protein
MCSEHWVPVVFFLEPDAILDVGQLGSVGRMGT